MLAEAQGYPKHYYSIILRAKKRIYIIILDRCFEKMATEIEEESLSDYSDFFEATRQIGFHKIEYLRKNPDISKILYEAFHSTPDELKEEVYKFTIHIKTKYGAKEDSKVKLMKELFDEIPLRDGVDNEQAYELINIVTDHFRKRIALELKDEKELLDDEYWDDLIDKKRKFLDMIRYGKEEIGR